MKEINMQCNYRSMMLLLGIFFISTTSFSHVMAQDKSSNSRTITVRGDGIATSVPDMATVRFGVFSRDDDPEQARRQNAQIAKDAMNALREIGISEEKLSLQTLRLQPIREYDPQTRKQIDKGFEASRELVAVIENLDVLPNVVTQLVQKGANRLNGITYGLRDHGQLQNQALLLAVERAKEKALLMAGTLDVELGEVVHITEQNFNMPTPLVHMESNPRVMMAKTDAAPEPEAFAAGEIEVRAEVQIVFQLR